MSFPRCPCPIRVRVSSLVVSTVLVVAACGGSDTSAIDAEASPSAPDLTADGTVADEQGGAADNAPAEAEPAATVPPEPTATPTPSPTSTPEPTPTLTLEVDGLPELGADAIYEAWLVIDDAPVSAGTFTSLTQPVSLPIDSDAVAATAVVVTIETDDDPAPSATHVLAGSLESGSAALTVTDPAAIGVDFAASTGQYILATPTDGTGSPENERSGIWWTFIPRAQSLVLPVLPQGWIYEGWQVIDGVPVSTGTFVSQFGEPDLAAPFSGPQAGPPFPGEDFVTNAPAGLEFPRDLRGTEVVITVEPVPDTSADPFPIVPLRGVVPADAEDHRSYPVDNLADAIVTGTASIS